jgi:plastocyanin
MCRAISLALFLLVFSSESFGATVSGKIEFLTRRGQRMNPAETLVWLEPASAVKPRQPEHSTLATRAKTLAPHVLAVPVGSTVQFPNEDPISHNLFSVSSSNAFDLGLYRRGAGKSHQFSRPGLVNIYCNVHPNMSAVIHVMGSPYYSFADANGAFAIPEVPPGKYRVVAWSEQGGTSTREIEVGSHGDATVSLKLDGRNFRAQQHTNKYGKPYQTSRSKDY